MFSSIGIVSYGRALALFKLNDDHQSWIKDSEKILTVENRCILTNECLLDGSSGGSVLLDGYKTSLAIDEKWKPIDFC